MVFFINPVNHPPGVQIGHQVVSGLQGALYFICCLGVSTILVSEKLVTMWPTNDLIALTRKGSRVVGAQPLLFNKQNENRAR